MLDYHAISDVPCLFCCWWTDHNKLRERLNASKCTMMARTDDRTPKGSESATTAATISHVGETNCIFLHLSSETSCCAKQRSLRL